MMYSHAADFISSETPTQILLPTGKPVFVNRAWQGLWVVSDEAVSAVVLRSYNILKDNLISDLGIRPIVEIALLGNRVTSLPVKYDPAKVGFPGRTRWVVADFVPRFRNDHTIQDIVLTFRDVTSAAGNVHLEHLFEDMGQYIEITMTGTFVRGTGVRPLTIFRLAKLDNQSFEEIRARFPDLSDIQIEAAIQFCEQGTDR